MGGLMSWKAGMLVLVLGLASGVSATATTAATAQKRNLELSDLARLRSISDPQVSPEGEWVAYVVRTTDTEKDRSASDLWMTSWDGARTVQLTFTESSESQPRFGPDGRYLGFVASRGDDEDEAEKSQVWLLDRLGGEAQKLTSFPGGVSEFAWSPDGKRLAVIASDPDPRETADDGKKPKTAPPIVIDRYQFKRDRVGYLRRLRDHLYLFDLESKASELLTPGDYDESQPSWSPDGTLIAFTSKREGDPDRNENSDLFLIEAEPGATARQLTTFKGVDGGRSPAAFSPDGRHIAYLQGSSARYTSYDQMNLAVIPVAGGEPRLLLPDLDRGVSDPAWSRDGKSITFLLEDDRNQFVARVPGEGGALERLTETRTVVRGFAMSRTGHVAFVASTPDSPGEVLALAEGGARALSHQNDELMGEVELGELTGIEVESRDGTIVHGIMVTPPGYQPGRRYPTIAYIHGGPVGQDGYEFDFTWQILAASGYVVVAPNYRGSSGRGLTYSNVIEADWGNLEVQDVLATVDHVVAEGIADPERLGIGGWSYGGMTTNYTIATDARFKAAVSGAGIANMLAGYGTDQYTRQYENEVGLPWKSIDTYLKISYPFYHADRIQTPTLFLCGEKDFNVPLLNSEQMYQALKSLGVETQLVIYPGQFHGLTKPSYQRDRLERYIAWYDRFLKDGSAGPTSN